MTIMYFGPGVGRLRTYEGCMLIKWFKNDSGEQRCLTIDTKNRRTLGTELRKIRELFKTTQDPESNEKRLAYSVSFEMDIRP